MDLKSLGSGTWSGFSDKELHEVKGKPASNQPQVLSPSEQLILPPPISTESIEFADSEREGGHVVTDPQEINEKLQAPSVTHIKFSSETSSSTDTEFMTRTNLSLDELQKRQNEMEEENKKKKKILEQTLMKRYQQTKQESFTLENVRSELGRLDQLVTRDVSILREKIDLASREYSQAQSRYATAESEYVAAKMELHSRAEKKELLSEHLCAVIQQTEIRKAHKLAELMQELNLSDDNMCLEQRDL